jgi:ABC-type uncharacterized transport system involved in gliding motility auxiliary subunit
MGPRLKKLAPFCVFFAILAALVSLGLFIIRQEFDLPLQISLGLILIGLAFGIIFDPDRSREIITGRQAKYSSNAFVLSLAVLGILVAVNYLAMNNPLRWDISDDKDNSLSIETIEILERLPEKVTAKAFFTSGYPTAFAEQVLDKYRYNSRGKFEYQFIDPDRDPLSANAARVTRDGTIVFEMAGLQEQISYPDEREFTSALLRLINPGSRVLYFLTGHGEIGLDSSEENGINRLKGDLESKNYTLKTLNLIGASQIPADALVIIINRPLQSITNSEAELLKSFVAEGKSIVLLLEPDVITGFPSQTDPLLVYLNNDWGITFSEDILIDPNVNPPLAAVADYYATHLITQKMQSLASIFPTVRSIKTNTNQDEITSTELVKSSFYSWGETDFSSIESNQVSYNEIEDFPGPLTIAVAAEDNLTKSRIVVFGDADFAADDDYMSFGNGVLIVNAIDWAAHQDALIDLTVRERTQRFILPPQKTSLGLVLFGSVFLIPILILFSGIVVFFQRRKRT